MSNSKRKMAVTVKPTKWGKRWAEVRLLQGNTFYPSFEDLHRIIRAIGLCEAEKYPTINAREKLAQFLIDAVWTEDWEVLAKRHQIPIRCGETVIDTNGAKLD